MALKTGVLFTLRSVRSRGLFDYQVGKHFKLATIMWVSQFFLVFSFGGNRRYEVDLIQTLDAEL